MNSPMQNCPLSCSDAASSPMLPFTVRAHLACFRAHSQRGPHYESRGVSDNPTQPRFSSTKANSSDLTYARDDLLDRVQEPDKCSSQHSPEEEGGILGLLLQELNDTGRLYRESGYLSNAVDMSGDLPRPLTNEDGQAAGPSSSRDAQRVDLPASDMQVEPVGRLADNELAQTLQQHEQDGQPPALLRSGTESTLSVDDAEGLDLRGSGNILGEDNMFTGAEALQNKGKARKRLISQTRSTSNAEGQANDAIVADFAAQLKSYRSVKADLTPWISSFSAENHREPLMADAEATGKPFLIGKFQEYMSLRSVMLDASQNLRGKLGGSPSTPSGPLAPRETMNANGSSSGKMNAGASRMAKALQYKQEKPPSLTSPTVSTPCKNRSGNPAKDGSPPPKKAEFKAPPNLGSASARVKSAMLAAAKYKKKAPISQGA